MLRLSHLTDMMARTLRRRSEPLDGFALGTSVVLHAAFLGFLATVRFAAPLPPQEIEVVTRIHLNDPDEPKLSKLALRMEQKPSDGPAKAPVRIRRVPPKPKRLRVVRKAPPHVAPKARGRGKTPYIIVRGTVRKPATTFRKVAANTTPKDPSSTPPLPTDIDTAPNEVKMPPPEVPVKPAEPTEPRDIEAPPAPKEADAGEPARREKPEPAERPRSFERERPKMASAPAQGEKPEAESRPPASNPDVKPPDVLPTLTGPKAASEPPKSEAPKVAELGPEKHSPAIEGARAPESTNPVRGGGTPGGARMVQVARRSTGSAPGEEGGIQGSPDKPAATGPRPDVIASAPSSGGPELPGTPGGPRSSGDPAPGGKRIASLPADTPGGVGDAPGDFQASRTGIPGLPTGGGLVTDTPARAKGGGSVAAVALRDPGRPSGGTGGPGRVFTGDGPGAPGTGRPTPGGTGGPGEGPSASAGGGEGLEGGGGPGRTNGAPGVPTLLPGDGDPAPLGPGGPGDVAAPGPQGTAEPRRGGGDAPLPIPGPAAEPGAGTGGPGLITLPAGFNILPGGPSGEGEGGPDAGTGGKAGLGNKPNAQGVYVNTTGEFDVPLAVTTSNYQFNAPALNRVVDEINGRTKLKVKLGSQAQPLKAGAVKPAPVMVFNGHKPFILTNDERKAVKDFVAKGGLIWADFTGGPFDASFAEEMRKIFGQTPAQLGPGHPIYRSYYALDKVPAGDTGNTSPFEGINQNGRLAVVVTRNRYFGAVAGAPHVSQEVQEGAIQAVVNIYVYGAQNYKASTE